MISLIINILLRIFANSYLNVFQKILTNNGEKSSIINFYTYFGLTAIALITCPLPHFTEQVYINMIIIGILGALGNYFIIKALSCGELSTLAPINSYKPIVALFIGIFILKEFPGIKELFGILLIILGTFFIANSKLFASKALTYRVLALIFSATEAIFIKKLIILTDITSAFLCWAFSGFVFSAIFTIKQPIKISKSNIKYQIYLILMVGIMQYTTNYVFSKINVSYALALFQLSTLLSVFLGVNLFKEKNLFKKLIGSLIMMIGAIAIII